ncbi:zinc ribbon domain-containing protein [bacterium]|nr:zinc ribbon domain-containing protein [bacterium]
MFCPKCGAENPDGSVFCQGCGFQLAEETTGIDPTAAATGYAPGQSAPLAGAPPASATGWTFAGFVPFGIFAFLNGNTMMGVVGLAVNLLLGPLYIAYAIYIGIAGRKLAWENRQFSSVEEFEGTMKSWNMWGIILLIVGVVGTMFWGCATCVAMMSAAGGSSY